MRIEATIRNSFQSNEMSVATEGSPKTLSIPGKANGYGSSVNGGELLFLALATCYCNDIYREAAKLEIKIDDVRVTVSGEFGREGEPAKSIRYRVDIKSANTSEEQIKELIDHVDRIAEIHNTLRKGISVALEE
jgi:uncharacterized OsmC-like protein